MYKVMEPSELSLAVMRAFNDRNLEDVVALYEPEAILIIGEDRWVGIEQIRSAMESLLQMPGVMSLRVNFCTVNGDLAVVRADYAIRDGETVVMAGSSVELARRQADGSWRYLIDNATGASLPPAEV